MTLMTLELILYHLDHNRAAVQEIVIQYLKHTDCDTAIRTLYALAFREHPNGEFGLGESSTAADTKKHQEIVVKLMNDGYKFASGDRGGVIILYKLCDNQTRPGGGEDILAELEGVGGADAHENRALSLVELILPLKNHNIAGEFFLYLMQKLTSFISWKKEELQKKEESGIEHLQGTPQNEAFHESNLLILSLLALMCEKLGPSILKSTDHMLAFIRATLERGCSLCKQEQLQCDPFLTETLSMAMGMLSAILGGAVKIDSSDRKSLQALIPFLKSLSNQHPATEVQEMANDLRIAIATHGAVWSQKSAVESLGKRDPASEAVVENGSRPCQRDSHKGMSQSEFVTAFKDLTDPLLPVRGFAMVRIAALIYAKDAEAIQNADTLLEIFEQQLAHDDSYIYLAAIKGLVALGSVRTEKVISSLTREMTSLRVANVQRRVANTAEIKEKGLYVGNNEKDHGRPVQQKRSVELRLKLVEALVKVTQDCGEMLPKYSQLLISTLLSGVHDPEALVRASSLSNLADVFRLLRFSIGPIIHEVFNCLHSVLQTDRSEHVRRAAVNVITLLLKGLGADSLQVLDSVLKELYRLLKTVDETDPDEITRTHARAALGELDTIMRTFLFPCPSYTKRIQVLP